MKEDENPDITVDIGNYRLNYRVGALIEHEGKILLHKADDNDYYAIPGGRVKAGENSDEALKREVKEEMGVNLLIDNYFGMIENFFNTQEKNYHELMALYHCHFEENCSLYEKEEIRDIEEHKNLSFFWIPIEEIDTISLRPVALKEEIKKGLNRTIHIIHREI